MSGFEAALLAWGVFCLALLIVALGCIDDLRDELRRERAMRAMRLVDARELLGITDPKEHQ